jgi:3-dehydro-L-gulonate 2-dehydrogenase
MDNPCFLYNFTNFYCFSKIKSKLYMEGVFMRVPFEELKAQIKKAMLNAGLSEEQAEICAQTHAESSRDGVYSHGLNRVPHFVDYVKKGWVNINGKPELIKAVACMENYDGNQGIGIIHAKLCMNRAVDLAKEHGVGIITLRNTTHWMRGGAYAWDAANAGYMSICWTNVEPNMPLWGAKNIGIGNNPFCFGIPCRNGSIVLDMAMSQYSNGKLKDTLSAGKQLPYPGGFDKDGNLTTDPGAIEESKRILPTGYWKGSGLAVALDMAAAILSNGRTASEIEKVNKGNGTGCSQVFIAFDPHVFSSEEEIQAILDSSINQIHSSVPVQEGGSVTYPGERSLEMRRENSELGIPVDEGIWRQVCSL